MEGSPSLGQDPSSPSGRRPRPGLRMRVVVLAGEALVLGWFAFTVWKYTGSATTAGAAGCRSGRLWPWDLAEYSIDPGSRPPCGAAVTRLAIHADVWLIPGYGVALLAGATLAVALLRRRSSGRWTGFALAAAVLALAAHAVQDGLLLRALDGDPTRGVAAAITVILVSTLIPAAAAAVTGFVVALARAVRRWGGAGVTEDDGWAPLPVLPDDPQGPRRPGAEPTCTEARWARGFNVPPSERSTVLPPGGKVIGIGLSGGGIRAATVALGVLQAPTFRQDALLPAAHLVSVSGGGYTAGAFVQALTTAPPQDIPDDTVQRSPSTAFLVGTPEEDHVRRHASYLADTPARLLTALSMLLWHLLLTLLLLFGPAVVAGVAIGWFYRLIPVAGLGSSVALASRNAKVSPQMPHFHAEALWALGIAVALAVVLWLARELALTRWPQRGRLRTTLSGLAQGARLLAIAVGITVVVLPELIWVSSWLLHRSVGSLHITSPILVVLLTYATSIVSLASRKPSTTGTPSKFLKLLPTAVMRITLVVLTTAVLAATWLLLLGGMATIGLGGPDRSTWIVVAALVAAIVLLGGFTDETTLSLHPFYRRRLAGAFAVRRVRTKAGFEVAAPYPPAERTCLAMYAKPVEGFPHVVFAASATLGEDRTPPGDRRLSYTFSGDWVGGPDVGYVPTATLQRVAPRRFRRDLTVQGAVALSGAAIAASLGGQGSQYYELLFAISGARLGAWMPNPAHVLRHCASTPTLREPGLPRSRRLNYLLRELFGVHPPDGPLLQVTDGGFYDNLGLVELFRRGCTHIYCVDASGDSPPAATTLAQALVRAHEELGVETTLDSSTWETSTAGGGKALTPETPLAQLSKRLSETGIITARFTYPACSGYRSPDETGGSRPRSGILVVAKASLWPDVPYELLAYAQRTASFPHESTADQFFDDEQYVAYTSLGRLLGTAAVAAMEAQGKKTTAPRGCRRPLSTETAAAG